MKTKYNNYSSLQLDGLFRELNWTRISERDRLDACQELENRFAAEHGTIPRTVIALPMNGSVYGEQRGNCIFVNENLLADFQFVDYNNNGRMIGFYHVDAAGWQTYDTIAHESMHGYQLDRGDYQSAASYIMQETDSAIYRIQKDEAEAFDAGQTRTFDAIMKQRALLDGKMEPDMAQYIESMEEDSYDSALEEAQKRYGDDKIDETLAQYIQDRENGVEPNNPSLSYQALQNAMDRQNANLLSKLINATNGVQRNGNLREGVEPSSENNMLCNQQKDQNQYSQNNYSENGWEQGNQSQYGQNRNINQENDGRKVFENRDNSAQRLDEKDDGRELFRNQDNSVRELNEDDDGRELFEKEESSQAVNQEKNQGMDTQDGHGFSAVSFSGMQDGQSQSGGMDNGHSMSDN